jgi:hypothetical protein
LKALLLGIHYAKNNKADSIKAGFEAKLQGEPEIVHQAYDLFAPGFSGDLSVNVAGLQVMLEEDKRNNLIAANLQSSASSMTRYSRSSSRNCAQKGGRGKF